jgi:hypothetical protein
MVGTAAVTSRSGPLVGLLSVTLTVVVPSARLDDRDGMVWLDAAGG